MSSPEQFGASTVVPLGGFNNFLVSSAAARAARFSSSHFLSISLIILFSAGLTFRGRFLACLVRILSFRVLWPILAERRITFPLPVTLNLLAVALLVF